MPAAHHERGQAAVAAAVDAGPHLPQRVGDAVHGPAGDRLVALQDRQPVEGGHIPGQQADPGARVPHIQHPVRLVQPIEAAGDALGLDERAHGSHGLGGAVHVVAA